MSVGSLDPSKMPCHQAGHGAQKGQGQGTQTCRHDAEGRRGFVLRFKETCFLKGGHWSSSLSLWDILAKVGEKTPIQFMFICLWIGGRTAKSKRPSTRVSWMSDGSISALRMSLLPLFCTGQLVSRMSFWWCLEMLTPKHCGRGCKLECDHPVVDQRRIMFQCSETRERNL